MNGSFMNLSFLNLNKHINKVIFLLVVLLQLFLLVSCRDSKIPVIPSPPSGWKLIGEGDNSTYSIYESDVKEDDGKYGKFIRFWVMTNYLKVEGKDFSETSSKTKFVMNCKRKDIRTERTITYSKFNGEGNVTFDSGFLSSNQMEEIVPQSIGDTYFNLLCSGNPFAKYLFVPVK